MVVCLLALARMHALWQLLLFYSIGRALSQQAVNIAAFTAVSNWFIRRRAIVVSIVGVAPRLGLGLLPLLVVVMIDAAGTWRAGWLALAAVAAVVGVVPPLLFMHRRPEDRGLRPDGDPPPEIGGDDLPLSADLDFSLREAVRTRSYWLLGIGIALIMFCGGAINFHQIPHLEQQGLARTAAALVVTVFSIAGALGGLLGGAFATRVTVRWTMVASLCGMAVGVLLLAMASGLTSALLYAVTYGLFFGSSVTLMQGGLRRLLRPPRARCHPRIGPARATGVQRGRSPGDGTVVQPHRIVRRGVRAVRPAVPRCCRRGGVFAASGARQRQIAVMLCSGLAKP